MTPTQAAYAERVSRALESIARSLEAMANPPVDTVVAKPGDFHVIRVPDGLKPWAVLGLDERAYQVRRQRVLDTMNHVYSRTLGQTWTSVLSEMADAVMEEMTRGD